MKSLHRGEAPLYACLIYLVFTLLCFGFYHARTLQGDINYHILAGEMFGMPQELKARGLDHLYRGPGQTGWDGQFYYYMANDVLAVKDTPKYIDAPSYRYQRIGLSLYTAIIAKVLGQDWVSPAVFFWSYLCLMVLAVWAGARIFQRLGASPYLILLWALGIGPQITLFSALPDAAADAFLILALFLFQGGRLLGAAILFAFAGLSREVYTLFPFFILVSHGLRLWRRDLLPTAAVLAMCRWRAVYWLGLPCLVVVLWRLYVIHQLGVAPEQEARGILGWPFAAWIQYFLSRIDARHFFGVAKQSYREAICLLLFLSVLIVAGWLTCKLLLHRFAAMRDEMRGMAMASLCLVGLYVSFGHTVIMHYTGYYKAVSLFFFVIPCLLCAQQNFDQLAWRRKMVIRGLVVALVLPMLYNLQNRVLPKYEAIDAYTNNSMVTRRDVLPCLDDYSADLHVTRVSIKEWGVLDSLFGRRGALIIDVNVTNSGSQAWVSSQADGGVFMSYQWIDRKGKSLGPGIWTALVDPLTPGQTRPLTLQVQRPRGVADATLRLSPVQDGCGWFYQKNPDLPSGF